MKLIRLLMGAWKHRGLLAIGSLALTLLGLWLRFRPAEAAQRKAVEAARLRRLQAQREASQARRSGTQAQAAEALAKAHAAKVELEAAEAALAAVEAKRAEVEAELTRLSTPEELRERERDLLR